MELCSVCDRLNDEGGYDDKDRPHLPRCEAHTRMRLSRPSKPLELFKTPYRPNPVGYRLFMGGGLILGR